MISPKSDMLSVKGVTCDQPRSEMFLVEGVTCDQTKECHVIGKRSEM